VQQTIILKTIDMLPLIVEFAPLFSKLGWERAKTLLVGAILAVGRDYSHVILHWSRNNLE
jgi:hypothetical protein